MKFLNILRLFFIFINLSSFFAVQLQVGKKNRKKLKDFDFKYDYSNNFPRYLQVNTNANTHINPKLKTFGTDEDTSSKTLNKVTYRRPIYVGVDDYKSFSKNSKNYELETETEKISDTETKFLETSAGEPGKQKEILFNSNQVDYYVGSYRKAFVIGDEKNPQNLTIIGSSHNKTDIKFDKSDKSEKAPYNNNLFDKENTNTTTIAKLFDNEADINNLSLKLAELVKNILIEVVDEKIKNQDYNINKVDQIIERNKKQMQSLIKRSLTKLKKENKINNMNNIKSNLNITETIAKKLEINSQINKARKKKFEIFEDLHLNHTNHTNHTNQTIQTNQTNHIITTNFSDKFKNKPNKEKLIQTSISSISNIINNYVKKITNYTFIPTYIASAKNTSHTAIKLPIISNIAPNNLNNTYYPITNIISKYVENMGKIKTNLPPPNSTNTPKNSNITISPTKTKIKLPIDPIINIISKYAEHHNSTDDQAKKDFVKKVFSLSANTNKTIDNLIKNSLNTKNIKNKEIEILKKSEKINSINGDVDDSSIISEILENFSKK